MEDTPLGQTVLIRKENNKDRLKHFGLYENRIRNEWRNFRAKQKREEIKDPGIVSSAFEKMFMEMFGERR